MPRTPAIGLIQGSIRASRYNDTITDWVQPRLERAGFVVRRIDPRGADLLPLQTGDELAQTRLRSLIDAMDGFVVVTPEYNHAAPGPLKTLIDAAGREWEAKPVGFVSYGGISGGLRAVETLRPVFAELHAVTLRDTVSFAQPWRRFHETGELRDAQDADAADAAMEHFCDRLAWWTGALSAARGAVPYRDKAA